MEIRNIKGGSSPSIAQNENKETKQIKVTASKVAEVVVLPVTLKSREVRILDDAKDLCKRIKRDWNLLTPSELAEQIVDLEGKVDLIEGSSPTIEKIKIQTEKLHFQFVFPIVLELSGTPETNMPFSFARTVNSIAKQILQMHSLEPLKQLSSSQVNEIMRYARGES